MSRKSAIITAIPVINSDALTTKPWFVYMLECQNNSIYTGVAVDVMARYAVHVEGKGARYTRTNPPKRLLLTLAYPDHSSALKAESKIKKLTAAAKRIFIATQLALCRSPCV